jgi:hypothetical protein
VAEKPVTHKKRRIEVRGVEEGETGDLAEPGEVRGLYVDGTFIPARRQPSGRFWTHRLPYTEFDSLTELGKALIDQQEV